MDLLVTIQMQQLEIVIPICSTLFDGLLMMHLKPFAIEEGLATL